MDIEQVFALLGMFMIGAMSATALSYWQYLSLSKPRRFALGAWILFWLGPPLYFIWTKGVMG
jgi:hypothetical protein